MQKPKNNINNINKNKKPVNKNINNTNNRMKVSQNQPRTFTGFGDYTEAKGRRAYEQQKKLKKEVKKEQKGNWWDTVTDVAKTAIPYLGRAAMMALTGFGDYSVDTNSITAAVTDGKIGGEIPIISNSHSTNIIRHKEYLGPVNGSTQPFSIENEYSINPGLKNTFPWLSPIANCYTRYRLRGAVVVYEPLASDYTTAGSLGFVALATQYNPLDPDFTNKIDMLNHEFSTSCKPSKTMIHPIECAKNQMSISEYFIRDADPPTNADIRFYDLGKVTVATGGNPVDTQVGDLWVTYEIEFFQPRLNEANNNNNLAIWCASTNPTVANPLGTPEAPSGGIIKNFGTLHYDGPGNTDYFLFPDWVTEGYYLATYGCSDGTPATLEITTPFFVTTNCTIMWTFATTETMTAPNVEDDYINCVLVKIESSGAMIQLAPVTGDYPFGGTPYAQFIVVKVSDILGQLAGFSREKLSTKLSLPNMIDLLIKERNNLLSLNNNMNNNNNNKTIKKN